MNNASTTPLVTIITPAYNQGRYLAETIESVLSQDYPAVEYIVIDDGSTDTTPEVIERYAGRLTAIRQENQGQARTINRGVDLAQGKYVGYLSSDDVLYPQAISRLVDALEADPSVVCAFPDANLIDASSQIVKHNVCRPFDLTALIVEQECYIGPGALYRIAAARQVGGWKPQLKLGPDREFWMRLARFGEFHFLPEELGGYRLHTGSTSYANFSEAVSREFLGVLDAYFAEPDPDPEALARKDEAYGHANFVIVRNCIRGGEFGRALHYYQEARRLDPSLGSLYNMYILLRTASSKPIRLALSWLSALKSNRQSASGRI